MFHSQVLDYINFRNERGATATDEDLVPHLGTLHTVMWTRVHAKWPDLCDDPCSSLWNTLTKNGHSKHNSQLMHSTTLLLKDSGEVHE